MSEQNGMVEVIAPDGTRKWLPPAAAASKDVRNMGFTVVSNVDYGVKKIHVPEEQPDQAAPEAEAQDEAPIPAKRGRKPSAS